MVHKKHAGQDKLVYNKGNIAYGNKGREEE